MLSGQAGQLDRLVQTVRKQARSPPLVQLFENTFTALDRVRQVCCSRCPGRSLLDDPKRTCRVTARSLCEESAAHTQHPTVSTQLSAPNSPNTVQTVPFDRFRGHARAVGGCGSRGGGLRQVCTAHRRRISDRHISFTRCSCTFRSQRTPTHTVIT